MFGHRNGTTKAIPFPLSFGEGIDKYEEVYLYDYASPREARQAAARYLPFYNHERPHQALGYQTPAAVYFAGACGTADSSTGPI